MITKQKVGDDGDGGSSNNNSSIFGINSNSFSRHNGSSGSSSSSNSSGIATSLLDPHLMFGYPMQLSLPLPLSGIASGHQGLLGAGYPIAPGFGLSYHNAGLKKESGRKGKWTVRIN